MEIRTRPLKISTIRQKDTLCGKLNLPVDKATSCTPISWVCGDAKDEERRSGEGENGRGKMETFSEINF